MTQLTVLAPTRIVVHDEESCDANCPHFSFEDKHLVLCTLFSDVGLGKVDPCDEDSELYARCYACRNGEEV